MRISQQTQVTPGRGRFEQQYSPAAPTGSEEEAFARGGFVKAPIRHAGGAASPMVRVDPSAPKYHPSVALEAAEDAASEAAVVESRQRLKAARPQPR